MGITTVPQPLYSPDLGALWLLVIPKAQRLSLWENWADERGCDEGHWQAHTKGLRWGFPEVVGTVQQVHCIRRRFLWRGLDFHVCTINKSSHTNKIWKLIKWSPDFKSINLVFWYRYIVVGYTKCIEFRNLPMTRFVLFLFLSTILFNIVCFYVSIQEELAFRIIVS